MSSRFRLLLICLALLLVAVPATAAAVPARAPRTTAPAGESVYYTYLPLVMRQNGLVFRAVVGDSWRNRDQDVYQFTGTSGTKVTLLVDTLGDLTAFDVEACVSTVDNASGCFAFGDNEMPCSYAPPANACPKFEVILPEDSDGYYYLFVESATNNYAGLMGLYYAQAWGWGTMSYLNRIHNNQPGDF